MQRVLTAIIALIVVFVVFYLGYDVPVWALLGLLGSGAFWELDGMTRRRHIHPFTGLLILGYWAVLALAYAVFHRVLPVPPGALFLLMPSLILLFSFTRWRGPESRVRAYPVDALWSLGSWLYLTVSFVAMAAIWELAAHPRGARPIWHHPILAWLVPIWIADTFAYYGGRWRGRRPLASAISPKKTVEGFVAGLIGAFLAAGALMWWWSQRGVVPYTILGWLGWGLIGGGLGPMGDLLESTWKRWADMKDSSRLLPGHGGILDRLDSLIFTAPFYYFYWTLLFPTGPS